MERISHREMRNRSGEILRRVEAGESFEITNHGRPAARIVPPDDASLDALIAHGEARGARRSIDALSDLRRSISARCSRDLVDDARGHW
ncbi:type II toxin-antitoxin system Phd/YefM family antitoxin [Microbacterium aurantiacum]|uniref:Antitoxin n=2 Tax=Microbacterium aurantiacum TaxID=162393 RepID=A0A0N0RRP5_9MICO|nr:MULTISPECIES: type II toxin-antitoxin system prevent-host-death family antitoxin [Microbacterium]ODT11555.1 MAG: prevent-host-death protein [Microbacterium sp. SCN 70-18]ANG85014.1 prevent-host-death protein [Microbacterium chocolatum]KOS11903.1 prevent-host-death protein [Microbacterium chocolatum]MBN9201343.1 type II toxin-antitoxin system prevent-host-death family antitoxin [Microbacterium chocolatum]MDN4463165.1 type II toxin-antitoxin system prevent-host-death family antitoxin [Microba